MDYDSVSDDPIKSHKRRQVAQRRVGQKAECACGESRPEALISGRDPIVCAECDRFHRRLSPMDCHHPFGENNSPVEVPVRANDHRAALSTAQYAWPVKTIENKEKSILLAAAAPIRGYCDMIHFLTRKLRWVAEVLEFLDEWLPKHILKKLDGASEMKRHKMNTNPDASTKPDSDDPCG